VRTTVLSLVSLIALSTLMVTGALWAIAVLNGVVFLAPAWLRHFHSMTWNPVSSLATFNSVAFVFLMMPWAAFSVWVCWVLEGRWLDFLDPNGREEKFQRP